MMMRGIPESDEKKVSWAKSRWWYLPSVLFKKPTKN